MDIERFGSVKRDSSGESALVEFFIGTLFTYFNSEGEFIPSVNIKHLDWELALVLRELQQSIKTFIYRKK